MHEPFYCPRCDRMFVRKDDKLSMKLLDTHIKNAHPEYVETWESIQDDTRSSFDGVVPEGWS